MKFLDQNGVLTLWNKIKSNFFPSTGGTITKMINDSGDTVSVSILPTSGATLTIDEPSFAIETSIGKNGGCSMNFPLGMPMWRVYSDTSYVQIFPSSISFSDGHTIQALSLSHNQPNEYARPIQDLESILI